MSLLAPLFLLGALAALIPWLLHRLNSNDPPLQDFGSTMFLEPTETMSSKQTQLRYRKLLSLRMLSLALLAVLFAEPVIDSIKLPGGGATRHLLLIDTSLSQNHTARWQRTQTQANDIVNTVANGDEVVVITAASRFVQPASADEQDYSVNTARTHLNALKPTQGRLDYSRIAAALGGVIKDSRLPVHVHIVSDVQQSAMPDRLTDLSIDGIDKLSVYSTAQADDSNSSLSAKLDYAADNSADISVVVSNYSTQEVTRQLNVTANDTTIGSTSLTIAAGASLLHQFLELDTTEAAGELRISITPNDDLAVDDNWTLAVPDGQRTEVSVVGGSTETLATSYVSAAIESDPRYQTKHIAGDSLSAGDAGALVIVPDASTLSDRATSRLQQFIEDGGNALIAIGKTPPSTQMRKLFGTSNVSETFNNSRPEYQTIAAVDNTHPLTRGIAGNWRSLSVLRFITLKAQPTDKRIVELGNGSPLLLERPIGKGRAIFLNSALDGGWNNLALEPLFVAFVVRTIEYLSGEAGTNPYRSIGDSVSLPPGAQMINPAGDTMRAISDTASKGSVTLDTPGVYTIRSATGKRSLSVNTDPRESNINSISEDSLSRWRQTASAAPAGNRATSDTEQNTSKGFWRWLLPLLAIVVLAESLYSHRHLWVKREA